MASGKLALTVAMEFKRDILTIKSYAVYEIVPLVRVLLLMICDNWRLRWLRISHYKLGDV